ncbi:MAG: adenylate/guanylate cyclase domain-containing protein [Pseudomonadota bacterium]|nr:adenylate/guanylate cyclase domain-containing protein [Pseudomonadota bacterium]
MFFSYCISHYHAAMTTKVKRRLTTLLCADVEGYARLMEADEAGTLATLRRYRAAMATLIERHEGRIVNTWGDAIIAEFASVVEAVQCAVEMQQELSGHNNALADGRQMRFRIGINLGDVMVDGDDVYGDGVNVAARLQELAEPGGILISGPVYDQVHNKLSVRFDYLGHQRVKNVAKPVLSYRVMQGAAMTQSPEAVPDVPLAPAERPSPGDRGKTGLAGVWDWYLRLPRPIAAVIAVAVFLFLVNVFSGFDAIWFHWPVAVLLLIVVLWAVLRRKPS